MIKPFTVEKTPQITKLYTVYQRMFESDYRFKGETHDFWELVCVCAGKISVAADSDIFELRAGQAILHPPMQFHNINVIGGEPATVTVFTFYGVNIPDLKNKICSIRDITEINMLFSLAEKQFNIHRERFIVESLKSNNESCFEYIKRLELLLTVLEPITKIQKQVSRKANNYSYIVEVMNENISKRLSVTQIAQICKMSTINLQKTFSYYAGVGIMTYFNRLKMQYAAQLISEGSSVKAAAFEVGFQDQNYFSTVFKRIMGYAPRECNRK